ncbi:MAG: TolC family protein [Saprospiraceae bacterium]|nr:TolC family protein [Saprospiraceae bacterium]
MNRIIVLFLGMCFWYSATAQQPLSLAEAIEKGLENNYQIKISEANLEIAANNDDWVIAGRYPQINLTLNSNNGFTNTNNPASILREQSSFSSGIVPGIELNWTLFDGYRVRFTKKQLEGLRQLNEGNVQVAVENSIQAIINAYNQALVQQEQLEVLGEVLELSRDRINYQETRKEFGQATSFDLLQTQDAYLSDSTNYLVQENNLENAFRNLNLSMGVDDLSQRYLLTDELAVEADGYELEALKQKLLASNKNLQNLQINRELANINTRIQEAAKYPTVNLRTGATYNVNISAGEQKFAFSPEPETIPQVASKNFNYFLNFSATYNLFDWGRRKKNIENAMTEELIAQLNIDDLKRNLFTQLENTYATYNNQKRLLELTDQLQENASRNLNIANERFKGGLINSFDYRSIQLSYINATQSRLNALLNLKNTEVELIRLIGGLVR